jgi:outer membrane protein assembly factor BamB
MRIHFDHVASFVVVTFVFLLGVMSYAQSPDNQNEYRDFRDMQGRTIQARVLDVNEDQVTIQRSDGAVFTVLISIFSQSDQDHIHGLVSDSPVENAAGPSENDWTCFRGPTGMGVAKSSDLPTEWDAERSIIWKTPLPGSGASSPVTFGDRIYLTCYSGYFIPGESEGNLSQLKRHLIAFQRDTGEVLWDRTVPAKLPEEDSIRDHGYAANTPVVDADRIYAFFGKSGVFAFDHNGEQLWQADVGSKTSGWGTAASPILYEDLLIINASVESESLIALEKATGEERWQAADIRESWNTPLIVETESGRCELVIARHGDVLGFEPETGKPLWSCKTDIRWYMVPTATASDGVVYYIGGRSGPAALAVRVGGDGEVTDSHRLWVGQKGSNVSSPIYLDGRLYWANDSQGIAYCAEASTGDILYEERLDRAGQVYASPVLAGERIYYFSRSGRMFVLAAKPEYEQLYIVDFGDGSRFDASPVVDGDRLLVRSGKFLYCLGEPN